MIIGVIPKEGLARPRPQSFFWYDNDKDLKGHIFAAHALYRACVYSFVHAAYLKKPISSWARWKVPHLEAS